MNFKKNNSINFLNLLDLAIINYSIKIIVSLIIIIVILLVLRINLGRSKISLKEDIMQLKSRNIMLESSIKETKNMIEQGKKPDGYYNLFAMAIKVVADRANLTELDYIYPDLILRGRANDEKSLEEIIKKAEKLRCDEIESSSLRSDYRSNPGFIFTLSYRGEEDG